jgi:hypothetical protein
MATHRSAPPQHIPSSLLARPPNELPSGSRTDHPPTPAGDPYLGYGGPHARVDAPSTQVPPQLDRHLSGPERTAASWDRCTSEDVVERYSTRNSDLDLVGIGRSSTQSRVDIDSSQAVGCYLVHVTSGTSEALRNTLLDRCRHVITRSIVSCIIIEGRITTGRTWLEPSCALDLGRRPRVTTKKRCYQQCPRGLLRRRWCLPRRRRRPGRPRRRPRRRR